MPINMRSNEPADGSITEQKIANGAVTTTKVQDNAISVFKVANVLAMEHFFGSEAQLSHTGTTPTVVASFNFVKNAADEASWKKLSYQIKLVSSVGTNTATFRLKIDGTQVGTDQSTTNTTETILEENLIDISALANGNHLVELELENSTSGEIATLNQIDIYFGKK